MAIQRSCKELKHDLFLIKKLYTLFKELKKNNFELRTNIAEMFNSEFDMYN